jgi:hypothetical protein
VNGGIHISHCCLFHGCKYGRKTCPVYAGKVPQEIPCEDCSTDDGAHLDVEELAALRHIFTNDPTLFDMMVEAAKLPPREAANLARKLAPKLLSRYVAAVLPPPQTKGKRT